MSIKKICSLRDRLYKDFSKVELNLVGEGLIKFVELLASYLPSSVPYRALYRSALTLSAIPNKLELFGFFWRLAGNLPTLKKNQPISVWTVQKEPEWVTLQVISYSHLDKEQSRKKKAACQYTMKIMNGSSCSLVITKIWPTDFVYGISRRVMGFTSRKKSYPFLNPSEFVGLRVEGEIDQKFCIDNQPGFDRIKQTTSNLSWNRKIMKLRDHNQTPCPFSFTHYCYQCPIGYKRCPAAVHRDDYVIKTCLNCRNKTIHEHIDDMACLFCDGKAISV